MVYYTANVLLGVVVGEYASEGLGEIQFFAVFIGEFADHHYGLQLLCDVSVPENLLHILVRMGSDGSATTTDPAAPWVLPGPLVRGVTCFL